VRLMVSDVPMAEPISSLEIVTARFSRNAPGTVLCRMTRIARSPSDAPCVRCPSLVARFWTRMTGRASAGQLGRRVDGRQVFLGAGADG
jgi:hypothetical protein